MKNEDQIVELLVEYLKRLDRLETQRQEDRKEFYSHMAALQKNIQDENEKDRREFRESFYFNQKNIASAQEDIRNQNKVMLAMLEEQGYHAERLAKLEKGK